MAEKNYLFTMSADFLSRLFHHVRTEAGTLRIAVYKTWQAIIWISSGDWLPKKGERERERLYYLTIRKQILQNRSIEHFIAITSRPTQYNILKCSLKKC